MAKPKTVVDLLAEQPDEALHEMRDINRRELARVQEELARLKVEASQIEQALKRGSDRAGRVTADEVLEAAREVEPPVSAAEVTQILLDRGRVTATVNGVRNHLNRLAARGQLVKHDDGSFSVKLPVGADDFPTSPADDDIPF